MKAITYTRIASGNQEISKESIQSQLEKIETYCKNNNLEVVKSFSEVGASGIDNKNSFKEIMDYISNSTEKVALCVSSLDRLNRSVLDTNITNLYAMATDGKVEIHYVSNNLVLNKNTSASDTFAIGMKLAVAKNYSDAIRNNVMRAFQLKRERGEITHKAPFGYMHKNTKQGKNVVIDEKTAPIVREIQTLYRNGKSYTYIVEKLRKERGAKYSFTVGKIKRISENEFYKGYVVFQGRRYPHKYQSIGIDM